MSGELREIIGKYLPRFRVIRTEMIVYTEDYERCVDIVFDRWTRKHGWALLLKDKVSGNIDVFVKYEEEVCYQKTC